MQAYSRAGSAAIARFLDSPESTLNSGVELPIDRCESYNRLTLKTTTTAGFPAVCSTGEKSAGTSGCSTLRCSRTGVDVLPVVSGSVQSGVTLSCARSISACVLFLLFIVLILSPHFHKLLPLSPHARKVAGSTPAASTNTSFLKGIRPYAQGGQMALSQQRGFPLLTSAFGEESLQLLPAQVAPCTFSSSGYPS